jgi:hypothetical protein
MVCRNERTVAEVSGTPIRQIGPVAAGVLTR